MPIYSSNILLYFFALKVIRFYVQGNGIHGPYHLSDAISVNVSMSVTGSYQDCRSAVVFMVLSEKCHLLNLNIVKNYFYIRYFLYYDFFLYRFYFLILQGFSAVNDRFIPVSSASVSLPGIS